QRIVRAENFQEAGHFACTFIHRALRPYRRALTASHRFRLRPEHHHPRVSRGRSRSGAWVGRQQRRLRRSDALSGAGRLQRRSDLDAEKFDAFLRQKLDASKRVIESHTGQPVRFLAYPYGDYDDAVVAAARRAGYEAGLLSWSGPNNRSTDPMKLRRFAMVS